MRHHFIIAVAAVWVAAFVILAAPARADDTVTVYTAGDKFADVLQDTADAIINRGFTIDHRSHIGDMLTRTGADVGSTTKIYTDAQALQFCSAVYSRRAMEADPANIAFCPYVIFVYERVDRPGVVNVGFRRLPEQGSDASRAALADVNKLLDEIAREGAGKL